MDSLDVLPDEIFINIFQFLIDEFKMLPSVSQRFHGTCLNPVWFQQWTLFVDPNRFKPQKEHLELDFEERKVVVPNWDALARAYIPWQHFGWVDFYMGTTDETSNMDELWNMIPEVAPHFSCVEISPAERKLDNPIVLDLDKFIMGENLIHFTCYGIIQPSLLDLSINRLQNVRFLELNVVRDATCNWLQPVIDSLPHLALLDLWRCEWAAEESPILLPQGLEVFRMAYCSKCPVDLSTAEILRVINVDCEQIVQPEFLLGLSALYQRVNGNVAIICPHLDMMKDELVKTLEQVLEAGIVHIYLPRTDDMNKYEEMIKLVQDSTTISGMDVEFSLPPQAFYANSINAQVYRRLKTYGRLRGTISWENTSQFD